MSRKSNSGRNNRNRSKPKSRNSPQALAAFWGDPASLPTPEENVHITSDPTAVVRSLGRPPIPGQETIALHYFEAVYERAVTLAGALAAAGDLIAPEELDSEEFY